MANQPITVKRANELMTEYRSYMTDLGVIISQQTQSVSFDTAALAQWFNAKLPHMDELRICMGVYPSGETHAGRITVALWPYMNGQPATEEVGGVPTEIEPFNEGTGQP